MDGVIAASADSSNWTFGAAILSFAFPMILTIVVLAALYVVYTKPEVVPGHSVPVERPLIYTPVPGNPAPADGENGDNNARTEDGA